MTHTHDRYGYADLAGQWLFDNVADTYGAHGFTYSTGQDDVTIATGGDGAITIGIYADDDALIDGDPIAFHQWDEATPDTIADAIDTLRAWVNP